MKVLAVVAHPDDEVLGVGGTLARHVREGDQVRVVVVCQNTFRKQEVDAELQLAGSMLMLGIPTYKWLSYDDQLLDQQPFQQVFQVIESACQWTPMWTGIVYTHWHKDLNRDHRIVNEAVQLMTRPKTGAQMEIREFPTPSSTEYSRETFQPNLWIDISETLDQKIQALECYAAELQSAYLPRNGRAIRELNRAQGRQVGVAAAEVFDVVRRLI